MQYVFIIGDINEIVINPSQVAQYVPLLENEGIIGTFSDFTRKYADRATDKELYALYCYYYGDVIWNIVVESGQQGWLLVSLNPIPGGLFWSSERRGGGGSFWPPMPMKPL